MPFLCMDFVNSQWYNSHKTYKEMLDDSDETMNFFKQRGFNIDIMPDQNDIADLFEIREFLNRFLADITTGKTVTDQDTGFINRYIEKSYMIRTVKIENNRFLMKFKPVQLDWDWIKAEILNSLIELLSVYDISRVKVCENPECGWFFYDESKSRTRRWCDDTCGNLMKVRRYRQRQKSSKDV